MATSRLERIGTIFTRKKKSNIFLETFSKVISNSEAEYNVLKENEQQIVKSVQQITIEHKKKLKAHKEIYETLKIQTEGLLLRGAIKPDDRPIWLDVYKAFPPSVEPKFARPKLEFKPIRQILYKEDIIRAKFHSKGHGLSVNMLSAVGETHTKRLIRKYEQFQSDGIAEDEKIHKSVDAVDSDRQAETTKISSKKSESVTAQVLADADLKNIFKE